MEERNYSEQTALQIDTAVKTLVEDSHLRARTILQKLRPALNAMASLLQEKEVMSGEEVQAVLREHTGSEREKG